MWEHASAVECMAQVHNENRDDDNDGWRHLSDQPNCDKLSAPCINKEGESLHGEGRDADRNGERAKNQPKRDHSPEEWEFDLVPQPKIQFETERFHGWFDYSFISHSMVAKDSKPRGSWLFA